MQEGRDGIAGNRLTRVELLAEFDGYLRERYQKPPDQARMVAKAMLEQFRDRNFILSRFGPGLYGFVHRALLEYCCADEIVYRLKVAQELTVDDLVTDVFGAHAEDPVWREVLLLAAGMIHERFLARVVDHLLALVRPSATRLDLARRARLLVLTLRCVSEARRITQLAVQCNALIEVLTALLTEVCTEAERNWYSSNNATVSELVSAVAAVKEVGATFPGWNSYAAWYRTVHFPVSRYVGDAATSVTEIIVDLAAGFCRTDLATRRHLLAQARQESQQSVRRAAVRALAHGWPDETTRTLLIDLATTDPARDVRLAAVQVSAEVWPDERTRSCS